MLIPCLCDYLPLHSDGDEVTACFDGCMTGLTESEKTQLQNEFVYKQFESMTQIYCERRFRPGDASKLKVHGSNLMLG